VLCRKLAPALLTGNTVVIKPSEVTPLSTLEAVRLIDEHLDLPGGVINVVVGGAATGSVLVESEFTSLVSFTGHCDTGKLVMARAAEHLTHVSLELGGKAPAIVWKDADLDIAVPAIVAARHTNSGQVCTSAERVLVHEDILETFTERYIGAVRALKVGDPSGTVDLGPLVNAKQHAKTSAALANAVADGAVVVTGGGRPDGAEYERGYWFAPTGLSDVTPTNRVMVEETFGPVTPIIGMDSLEQALERSNASRYGLSAYVFSRDYGTVMRAVNDLQFGEVYINRHLDRTEDLFAGDAPHVVHVGENGRLDEVAFS
jgi:lactaldehyde dehydrogenase/glycolaldehyde dehydrogenase